MKKAPSWSGAWHPLAERFPLHEEFELREMAASIKERGQYVACVMGPDGTGLDGRGRVAACAIAGVEPRWEVYDGEPVPFIVEVNAERRHLSTGQRAMAVAIGLVEAGKRRNGRFTRGSVPGDNRRASVTAASWQTQVQRAGVILDHAPELADVVLAGDLALDAAHKMADAKRKELEQVEALGGELAALVKTGVIDVAEAVRRADEERRIAALPDDLAVRVRDGGLAVDEAEVIAVQQAERFALWINNVREALALLVPMAGGPLPAEFKAELSEAEHAALTAALKTWRRTNARV